MAEVTTAVRRTDGVQRYVSTWIRAWKPDWRVWALRVGVVIVALAAWQATADLSLLSPVFIGRPTAIITSFISIFSGPSTVLTQDLWTTVEETLVGFAIGTVAGVASGLVLAEWTRLERALRPVLTGLNSLPRIALTPLFILWFGLGIDSKIAVGISLTYFIVLTNTLAGLTRPDRDQLLLARVLGASEAVRLRKFVFRGALPTLGAGLELGLIYGLLGTVSAEIIGGTQGLGVTLAYDANTFRVNDFFAVLVLIMLITAVGIALIRGVIGYGTRWQVSETEGVAEVRS